MGMAAGKRTHNRKFLNSKCGQNNLAQLICIIVAFWFPPSPETRFGCNKSVVFKVVKMTKRNITPKQNQFTTDISCENRKKYNNNILYAPIFDFRFDHFPYTRESE